MEVIVEGEDLPPELFSEDLGWQAAVARRSSNKATVARSFETKMEGFAPKAGGSAGERQNGDRVKRKVIKAARMPPLPKEDAKIILRPRGGLDVSRVGVTAVGRAIMKASGIDEAKANSDVICPNLQQNIVVVSTPDRENASRYTRIKTIEVASKIHEVSAYEAAPHSTCKGVIRGITLSDGPLDLERNIVNARNPLALGAKRIKNTGTVIVLFDGFKVPNFVRYGPVLVRCFLYRKQVDNCYACGKLGHRADVCPSPNDVVCRGCGSSNTDDHHQCTPKCKLCGGPHITADKICRQRYQIPYVVRRRRWEKAAEASGSKDGDDMAWSPLTQECKGRSSSKGRSHSRGRSRTRAGYRSWSRGRSRSRGSSRNTARSRSRSRGRSGSRRREGEVRFETRRSRSRDRQHGGQPSWADRVRQGAAEKVTRGSPPECDRDNERLAQLERENKEMRDTIARLMAEISEIRSGGGQQPVEVVRESIQSTEVPVVEECERPAKKRAIVSEQDKASGRARSEIREMLSSLSESIKQLSETVSRIQGSMLATEEGYNQRFCKIESFLENVVAPVMGPRALPLPATDNSTTQSQQQHDGRTN